MFAVEVRDHIMIAHSFRGAVFGPAQALHGATFVVDAAFIADELDSNGIVVDIGRAHQVLKAVLGPLNYRNLDEALELTGSVDLNLQMQTLGRFYDRVVIKRGVAGAAVGSLRGVQLSLPAPMSDVVDTTGAGDAFAAGLISARLEGQDWPAALARANWVGAQAIQVVGDMDGLPRRAALPAGL